MTSGAALSGPAGVAALRGSGGWVLVRRDVVTAEGPDTLKFLQSQLSQDLADLDVGAVSWSFLLQPTGKLVGFFRVTRTATDAYRLDGDPGLGAGVETALRRFLIRTKCALTLTEGVECRSVRAAALVVPVGAVPALSAFPGYDIVGPNPTSPTDELPLVEADCFEYLRIERGIPVWSHELSESTIPNATGLVGVAVNFTKGCYVGQELVERIDSRGAATPKVLRRLRFAAAASGSVAGPADHVQPGTEVFADGVSRGTLTSVAVEPGGEAVVALGYLHRDVAVGAQVTGISPDGPVGSVSALEIG